MVTLTAGDLFNSKAQTLVNTVNCVGVMGKGIALEFKKRFPDMYQDYVKRCERHEVLLGKPYIFKSAGGPWILNFPTKGHWRAVARLEDIVRGLEHLVAHYKEWGITSLAMPPLGCGQGQLEWRVVGPTLNRYLSKMDISVELYAPHGTPDIELQPQFPQHDMSDSTPASEPERIMPAWVALVEILHLVESEPYHWPIGRIIFQKIAFVATMEGLPTGLEFRRGSYGPFSEGLKPLTSKLVNNGLILEEKQPFGNMFEVKPGPTFPDSRKSFAKQLNEWKELIQRTAELFLRLNTTESEIVAAVLFAANELRNLQSIPEERQVLDTVMQWKIRRKPPLNESEVALAVRNLAALGWLNVKASSNLPLPDELTVDA